MKRNLPWVELSGDSDASSPVLALPQPSGALCHAVFAGRVRLKPFDELSRWQWGWNAGALLEEALERQRLFIASQHPADDLAVVEPVDRRSLALRYLHDPAQPGLDMILLGKVCAPTAAEARAAASDYWCEIEALLPYDYVFEPVTSREAFLEASGGRLLTTTGALGSMVQIRRFEGILTNGATRLYLLGTWQASAMANEQIWRALASVPRVALLNITLRPTTLLDVERLAVIEMAEGARKLASEANSAQIRLEAEWAVGAYTKRLIQLRHPYLVQLHVAVADGVPNFLIRVINAALVQRNGTNAALLGCQAVVARNQTCLERWRTALFWLEPDFTDDAPPDPRFARLRYMMDVQEAHTAFRLPFPPRVGIPGASLSMAGDPV